MNKAIFSSALNELKIVLSNGQVISKTFRNRALFEGDRTTKIEILRKYILGSLELTNVSLKIK